MGNWELNPDMELVFRPIKIEYSKDIYKSLYQAINTQFIVGEKYKIKEIWHKDGYSIFGKCSNTPGVPLNQKVWFWSGEIVTKEFHDYHYANDKIIGVGSKILTMQESDGNQKESIILIKNLTIPEKVVRDNFTDLKKERKLKLKKINKI